MSRGVRSPAGGAVVPVALIVGAVALGQLIGLVGPDSTDVGLSPRRWPISGPVQLEAAVYGLMNAVFAAGIVLVYRATRIINFAHAAFGVFASVLFLLLTVVWRWSFWLAFPAVLAAAALLGGLVEVFVIRRFAKAPRLVLTVATIAVAQVIAGVSVVTTEGTGTDVEFGPMPRLFGLDTGVIVPSETARTPFTADAFELFPVTFRGHHLLAVGLAVAVLAAMAAFFRYTDAGVAIRGAAENEDRAALLGVNTTGLSALVWVMAAGLSALATVLTMPIESTSLTTVSTGIGGAILLRALAAAVLGRMENLPVTAAAAIGIAIVERSVFWEFSQTPVVDAALLGLILVALLVQRRRLARTEESASGTWAATEEVRAVPAELRDLPVVRRGARRVAFVVGAVVVAYPWVMSPTQTNLGGVYAIFGIIAVSLVVLTGWGGQISLGQFAFVAIGAVVGGSATAEWGLPFPVAIVLGSLAAAGAAVVLGLPALRIKGLYLAVTTMAFSVATITVLLNEKYFDWLLPGDIDRPQLLFIDTEDERAFYYVCVAGLVAAVLVAQGLRKTRTGRVLIAMRDNERAAQSFSINLVRTRLATFAISGFLAGFAGVLYAHHQHGVTQSAFAPEQSIQMFLMAVIGGLGSVTGALLGAIYLGTVNLVIGGTAGRLLASGAGVLAVLLFYPGGLGAALYSARDAWLRRIAIRDRIFVPSLVGDFRVLDGERVAIAPREEPVTVTYRVPSRIGAAGASQQERGWTM